MTVLTPWFGLLVCSGIAGCGATQDADDAAAVPSVSWNAMPVITRVAFRPEATSAPFGKVPIAADPRGGLFFYGPTDGPQLLTRLDSMGLATDRFGAKGEGPREISGAGVLLASGDTLAIYDTRKAAVVLFGLDGSVRGEYRLEALSFPLALDGARLYSIDQEAMLKHQPPAIMARTLGAGTTEVVLGEADGDFLEAVIPDPSRPPGRLPIPAFGVRGKRIAIGNPRTGKIVVREGAESYAIELPGEAPRRGVRGTEETRSMLEQMLAQHGAATAARNATLRERLDTLDRESLPWFAWPGVQFDDRGRLWVFSDRDDSTTVEIFAGPSALGRSVLACYHPDKWISLAKGWLALQCRANPKADVPYELQLYRIEG